MDLDKVLYGGDYNPEQWLDRPDILEEDIAMMQEAHINTVTLGVFSWSTLEPEEGKYNFGWLDTIMDRLDQAFWQRHPVPDHSGWQRNTQRCSV